jgi:hypothetical protein
LGTGYNHILDGTSSVGNKDLFKPDMSKQQVSSIALGAVKTMNKLIDDVMDDLIPKNFLNISHNVTKKNTESGMFQDK